MRAILVVIFTSALATHLAVGGSVKQIDNSDTFQALLNKKPKFAALFIYKDSCSASANGLSWFTEVCNLPENADVECTKSNNYKSYYGDKDAQDTLDNEPSLAIYQSGKFLGNYGIAMKNDVDKGFDLLKA